MDDEIVKDKVIDFLRFLGAEDISEGILYFGAAYASFMKSRGFSREDTLQHFKHFMDLVYDIE